MVKSEVKTMEKYKAITGYACWFYAILNYGKNIENRSIPTHFRGKLVLHTSKRTPKDEVEKYKETTHSILNKKRAKYIDTYKKLTGETAFSDMPEFFNYHSNNNLLNRSINEEVDLINKLTNQIHTVTGSDEDTKWKHGHIIGCADIINCYKYLPLENIEGDSFYVPWAFGDYCYVLQNVVKFKETLPAKGSLGLWNLTEEQIAFVKHQMEVSKNVTSI